MPEAPIPGRGPTPIPAPALRPPKPSLWSYWTFRTMVVLVVLGLGAGMFKWKGRALYRNWRETKVVAQAEAFLKEKKYADANVAARRALQLNELNVPATRVMAEIAEVFSPPDAILWRSRVALLEPGRVENLQRWAYTAIRFNNLAAARTAAERFPPEARHSLQFHEIAGVLSFADGRYDEAGAHWAAALAAAPQNEALQLNLAKAQLFASQSNQVLQAYATLDRMRAAGPQQVPALNVLLTDALRRQDLNRARAVAAQLQAHPAAEFSDLLLCLTVARLTDPPGFPALLSRWQEKSVPNPATLAAMIQWLNASQLAAQSVAWTAQLPADRTTPVPVALARAESFIALKDWTGLQALTTPAKWEEWDFLRLAYQARAQHENQPPPPGPRAKALWQDAVARARQRPERLEVLANLAIKFGWRRESEDVWWLIANGSAGGQGAAQVLYNFYERSGNTPGMQRALERLLALNPGDPALKNNLTLLNLLLNLKPSVTHRLGQELYEHSPTNASFVSTYAFSLHRQQKNAAALALLEQLGPAQLSKPSIAAYYGTILAADSQFDKARPYLTIAAEAKLLPEELQMVHSALTQVNEFRTFEDLYARDPGNPLHAANYAYALHRQRKTADGLALLARLTPAQTAAPAVAVRYAALLTSAGQWETARTVLARSPGTAALAAAADQLFQRDPLDPAVKLLAATLGILVDAKLADAQLLAQQLFDTDPTNPAHAATLAFALHRQGKSADALNLLAKLPEPQLRSPAVAPFYAVLLTAVGQLEKAATFSSHAPLNLLLPEERSLVAGAEVLAGNFRQLQQAYERAPADPAALSAYAFALHRQRKTADALRLLDAASPAVLADARVTAGRVVCFLSDGQWEKARAALVQNGDSPRLYAAAQTLHQADPADPGVKYLLAALGLLLDPRLDDPVRHANDLVTRDHLQPAYACAYAYALHRQGRTIEGLRALTRLGQKELAKPMLAFYSAILLASDGQMATAKGYLDLVTDSALLPEEKKLANDLRARIAAAKP